MLLIRHPFFALSFILAISCNQNWSYNEKQIFMNSCPDISESCDCQYQIAYKNFTYKEFNSILKKEANQKIKDKVNNLKDDFADCDN